MKNKKENENLTSYLQHKFSRCKDILMEGLTKLSNQRHLSVLRDSFATYLPFLIIGAIGLLFITVIFGGYGSDQNSILGLISKAATGHFELTGTFKSVSDGATKMFEILPNGTINCISIYVAIFIGFYLARSRNKEENSSLGNNLIGMSVSLFAFLAVTNFNTDWFGAKGLLPSIFISFLSVELYMWLASIEKLQIKMPNSVPPAVGRAFSKLVPIIITGISLALFNYIFIIIGKVSNSNIEEKGSLTLTLTEINARLLKDGLPTIVAGQISFSEAQLFAIFTLGNQSFSDIVSHKFIWGGNILAIQYIFVYIHAGDYGFIGMVYQVFTAPIMALVSSNSGGLGIAISYVILVGFFWFLGLHGANMMDGVFLPIWLSALAFNIADLKAGREITYIFSQPFFEGFIFMGGGMGTLMLILGTIIISKRQGEKEVAKFALIPGVFNINEPVVFGYPIVLNWRYFIPFVFIMPIMVIVAWLFIGPFGIVNKPTISMPWTTPLILGSLIVTRFDWKAIFPVLINLGISFAIYIPFILVGNKNIGKNKPNFSAT